MTPNGLENPTLHVNPGDTLNITVTNHTPFNEVANNESDEPFQVPNCGDTEFEMQSTPANPALLQYGMTGGSMNIHYHGTNTSCHEDNVVKNQSREHVPVQRAFPNRRASRALLVSPTCSHASGGCCVRQRPICAIGSSFSATNNSTLRG
jgi:hypothetical protein